MSWPSRATSLPVCRPRVMRQLSPWARSAPASSTRSYPVFSVVGARRSSAHLPAAQRLVSRGRHIPGGVPHSHIDSQALRARCKGLYGPAYRASCPFTLVVLLFALRGGSGRARRAGYRGQDDRLGSLGLRDGGGTESGVTLWHPQRPSYTFTIDFDEGSDAVSAAESLRLLFNSAPEGACAVTFQDETVDMAASSRAWASGKSIVR